MATKTDYNSLAAELLVPFAENEISKNYDGFSYVDPAKYRYRLLKAFPNGYTFKVLNPQYGKTAVNGEAFFSGTRDDVSYEISVPVFEEYILAKEDKTPLKVSNSVSMLVSAGLKAVCRELGLGLHLYDKAAKNAEKGSKGTTTAKTGTAPAATGDWDGSKVAPFKKDKEGLKWNELEDSFIDWLVGKDEENNKTNTFAMKEQARRRASEVGDAKANAESAVQDDGDDSLPF